MLPAFEPETGNLPPGIHTATWDEVVGRFGGTEHRRALLEGLRRALAALHAAGCRRVYLDGSFVTAMEEPNDFDACWGTEGVDLPALARMAPVFFDLRPGRLAQKALYRGELLPVTLNGRPAERQILRDFQRDRRTESPKGIVIIDLEALS